MSGILTQVRNVLFSVVKKQSVLSGIDGIVYSGSSCQLFCFLR